MAQHVTRSLLPSLCRRRAVVQWATPSAVAHSLRCFSSRPSGVIPHDQATGEALRDAVGAFAKAELEPHVAEWDEAATFPRELYKAAAEVGLQGIGYPSEYGGTPASLLSVNMVWEELARVTGSGGLCVGLGSHGIALPPILNLGSEELRRRVIPPVLAGDAIAALGITEPSGGSDVANLRTTALKDGDHYIVNGSKIFITSGMRADFYTVAVRTGEQGDGAGGISLLLIERDTPGFSRTQLDKQGWWCSDTAALHFDDCRVPASNLIGQENKGFLGIMLNFNNERIAIAVQAIGLARACLEEAVAWSRERHTFGEPLIARQVIQHKLVDMYTRIEATAAFTESVTAQAAAGKADVARVSVVKNVATDMLAFVSSEAVQILGGSGYMRGSKSERVYREVKVLQIGGGAAEIMKELAARQLGYHP